VPELPEITAYVHAIERRTLGQVLEAVRIRTPSLLKTFDPRVSELEGRRLTSVRRVGKRIVFELEGEFFAVVHLMIAGRFQWRERGAAIPKKRGHAAFDFPNGTLLLTEASSHKRASLHVVHGEAALEALDPGGVEPAGGGLPCVPRRTFEGEPHPEASAHRPENSQWHRKRSLRRDPTRSAALAGPAHETNYCAVCQTGGKLLKDRALSRLLREDWPATLEELEEGLEARRKA